jgi:hypothetical protein
MYRLPLVCPESDAAGFAPELFSANHPFRWPQPNSANEAATTAIARTERITLRPIHPSKERQVTAPGWWVTCVAEFTDVDSFVSWFIDSIPSLRKRTTTLI